MRTFWESRHLPHVLFLTFEEMKRDLATVIDKTSTFLGRPVTASERATLLQHLSFESMKANPYVNLDEITDMLTKIHGQQRKTHFMRKGKSGSWKEELSAASVQKLDEWIQAKGIPGLYDP